MTGLDEKGESLRVDCLVVDNGLHSSDEWKDKLEGGGGETLGSVALWASIHSFFPATVS